MNNFFKFILLACVGLLASCNYVPDTHKKDGEYTREIASEKKKNEPRKPYTGTRIKKHANGKVKSEINFVDGLQQGPAKEYHDNGTVYKDINYLDGKLHGEATIYDRKGRKTRMVTYKHGAKDGPMIRYFKSGKPKSQMSYKDGVPQNDLWEKDNRGNTKRNFGQLEIKSFQSAQSDELFAIEFRLDNGKPFEAYVFPTDIELSEGINRTYHLQQGQKMEVHQKQIRISKSTRFAQELMIAALYKTAMGNEVLLIEKEHIDLVHL